MQKLPLLLLATLAACDSQVDGNHKGDELAVLTGTVENLRTQPTDDAEVAVLWLNVTVADETYTPDTVSVEGNFPSEFSISIYEPPIDLAINDFGDSRFGFALIFAAEIGTDYSEENEEGVGVLGGDTQHVLVYVPEEIAPGTVAATILRGTPAPGFHIYNVGHLTEAESLSRAECEANLGVDPSIQDLFQACGGFQSFDDVLPAPADLDTPLEVELVDDLADLDIPNLT
jgi:hypothetical protein